MISEVKMSIWHKGNNSVSFPKVVQLVALTGGNETKGDSLGDNSLKLESCPPSQLTLSHNSPRAIYLLRNQCSVLFL